MGFYHHSKNHTVFHENKIILRKGEKKEYFRTQTRKRRKFEYIVWSINNKVSVFTSWWTEESANLQSACSLEWQKSQELSCQDSYRFCSFTETAENYFSFSQNATEWFCKRHRWLPEPRQRVKDTGNWKSHLAFPTFLQLLKDSAKFSREITWFKITISIIRKGLDNEAIPN